MCVLPRWQCTLARSSFRVPPFPPTPLTEHGCVPPAPAVPLSARMHLSTQLPLLVSETVSFLDAAAASMVPEPAKPMGATAVLDRPSTLRVLGRMFGERETAPLLPITDMVLVQGSEPVPPGYTKV
jgi:hypothetical protein